MEYGYVLAMKKYFTKQIKPIELRTPNQQKDGWIPDSGEIITMEEKLKRFDLITLFISIISFTIFNVYYWFLA